LVSPALAHGFTAIVSPDGLTPDAQGFAAGGQDTQPGTGPEQDVR